MSASTARFATRSQCRTGFIELQNPCGAAITYEGILGVDSIYVKFEFYSFVYSKCQNSTMFRIARRLSHSHKPTNSNKWSFSEYMPQPSPKITKILVRGYTAAGLLTGIATATCEIHELSSYKLYGVDIGFIGGCAVFASFVSGVFWPITAPIMFLNLRRNK